MKSTIAKIKCLTYVLLIITLTTGCQSKPVAVTTKDTKTKVSYNQDIKQYTIENRFEALNVIYKMPNEDILKIYCDTKSNLLYLRPAGGYSTAVLTPFYAPAPNSPQHVYTLDEYIKENSELKIELVP